MRRAVAIFLITLGAYGLTAGGHLYSPDEEILFRTARALARGEGLGIEPITQGFATAPAYPPRADGREYAQYGIGQPIMAVPLYGIGAALARMGSDEAWQRLYGQPAFQYCPMTAAELAPRWAVSWFNVILAALLATVLYLTCLELTGDVRAATTAALLYALGSMAWPHSRPFFTETNSAFWLLVAWYALLRAARGRLEAWCLLAGAATGWAALVRMHSAFAYPGLAVLLLGPVVAAARARGRSFLWPWAAFCIPALLAGGVLLTLNKLHFGGLIKTGYADQPEGVAFSTPLAAGLFGFLFSAGKGLFFFSPGLIPSLWSWGPLALVTRGRSRWILPSLACMILVPLGILSKWQNWPGGWCWGPRHIFMILPFLAIPAAAWLARGWTPAVRIITITALVAGVAVQALGCSQDFIRFHLRFFRAPGDRTAFNVQYDPIDFQIWSGFFQLQLRRGPDEAPRPVPINLLPRPIQDSLYIPQASVWAGYPIMLNEGELDNFWARAFGPAESSPPAAIP